MKPLYLSALLSFISLSLSAQIIDTNWTNQYDRTSSTRWIQIAEMPNGNYLISQEGTYYVISPTGDSLDFAHIPSAFGSAYDMIGTNDGVLMAGGYSQEPSIALIDTNLQIQWTNEIGFQGEARALMIDGSDMYSSGRAGFNGHYIAKHSLNGDTVWTIQLQENTFTQLSDIIKLSDGNFLASGNLDDYPIAIKFNASGDTLWRYYEPIFISFQKMNAYEKANGNIVLIAERHQIELDSDGNKLSDEQFTNGQFYDIEIDNDTVYVFGSGSDTIFSNEWWPEVQVRDMNFDSLGTFRFTKGIHPMANNLLQDVVRTPDGGFIAAGRIRDSINISNNTYNIYAVKINGGELVGVTAPMSTWNEVSVYPNPAHDHLFISGELSNIQVANIIDMMGRVVHSQSINAAAKEWLDLRALTPGTYTLQLQGREAGSSSFQRIVIAR